MSREAWYWLLGGLVLAGAGVAVAYTTMTNPSDVAGATNQPPGTWEFTLYDTDRADGSSCFVASPIASVVANQKQADAWAKAAGWGGGSFYSGTSNITGGQTVDSMAALKTWIDTQPTT